MKKDLGLFARYLVNGLIATAVHFAVLMVNLELLGVSSAGLASAIAAVFGISTSFVGSRRFVFRASGVALGRQVPRFLTLYGTVALFHGAVLLLWTDIYGFDYRVGFVLATALQIGISFFGNKILVFRG